MAAESINATHLFTLPDRRFHHSESFWSSFFALLLLDASRRGFALEIPVYRCGDPTKSGRFRRIDSLVIPAGLDPEDVVVEGRLGAGFTNVYAGILGDLDETFKDFKNLVPDIIIRCGNELIVIETKTVGAKLSAKEKLYEDFRRWLDARGASVSTYLLISAGHESPGQMHQLATAKWEGPSRLILWEQLFKAVSVQVGPTSLLRLIPDPAVYWESEAEYLGGDLLLPTDGSTKTI